MRRLKSKTKFKKMKSKKQKLNSFKRIPRLKKGELTKYGYKNIKSTGTKKRRKSLSKAVNEYGALKLLKKLGVLRLYHKNSSPALSKKYYDNQKWIRKKYNNQFKSSWKNSALFKT